MSPSISFDGGPALLPSRTIPAVSHEWSDMLVSGSFGSENTSYYPVYVEYSG